MAGESVAEKLAVNRCKSSAWPASQLALSRARALCAGRELGLSIGGMVDMVFGDGLREEVRLLLVV